MSKTAKYEDILKKCHLLLFINVKFHKLIRCCKYAFGFLASSAKRVVIDIRWKRLGEMAICL